MATQIKSPEAQRKYYNNHPAEFRDDIDAASSKPFMEKNKYFCRLFVRGACESIDSCERGTHHLVDRYAAQFKDKKSFKSHVCGNGKNCKRTWVHCDFWHPEEDPALPRRVKKVYKRDVLRVPEPLVAPPKNEIRIPLHSFSYVPFPGGSLPPLKIIDDMTEDEKAPLLTKSPQLRRTFSEASLIALASGRMPPLSIIDDVAEKPKSLVVVPQSPQRTPSAPPLNRQAIPAHQEIGQLDKTDKTLTEQIDEANRDPYAFYAKVDLTKKAFERHKDVLPPNYKMTLDSKNPRYAQSITTYIARGEITFGNAFKPYALVGFVVPKRPMEMGGGS